MSINPKSQTHYRFNFPVITVNDMANAQKCLLDILEIKTLYAIIGGSMGVMQALSFAKSYPRTAKKLILLATTAYIRPWAISINKIAFDAIKKDPAFKHGLYDQQEIKREGINGLAYGRMAGHISFLSPDSMDEKFSRKYVSFHDKYDLFGQFEVERYLDYNAYNFSKFFDPLSYLYIIKAMNLFDIRNDNESLEDALSSIQSSVHLFSFSGDILFRCSEMKEIHKVLLLRKHSDSYYYEISSNHGHDAFLVETDKFANIIMIY